MMKALFEPLDELGEYEQLKYALKKGLLPAAASGCIDGQREQLIAALSADYETTLVITENEIRARQLREGIRLYIRSRAKVYPAKDVLFYSADVHGNAIESERMEIIKALIDGEKLIIVMSAQALWDKLTPKEVIEANIIKIRINDTLDQTLLGKKLMDMGYSRKDQVDGKGEYSVRGGIIDIFPLTGQQPYRIELFGDEVDTIRLFDVESQRTVEDGIEEIELFPATQFIFSKETIDKGVQKIKKSESKQVGKFRKNMENEQAHRLEMTVGSFLDSLDYRDLGTGIESYLCFFADKTVSILDYLDKDRTLIIADEPKRTFDSMLENFEQFNESMRTRLEKGYILPEQTKAIYEPKKLISAVSGMKTVMLSTLDMKTDLLTPKLKVDFNVKSISSYNNDFELLVKELAQWKRLGYRVVLVCSSIERAKRIAAELADRELNGFFSNDNDRIPQKREIMVTTGSLTRGYEYPMIQYAVLSESDIFKNISGRKKKERAKSKKPVLNFDDLHVGDYVVHENHGIGMYKGVVKIETDHVVKDYIKIEYADKGVLYVPAGGLDVLAKYASAGDASPKMNRLSSNDWSKAKQRAKKEVAGIAAELVRLYAIRQSKTGYAFEKDDIWQREFEDTFPFEETEDQIEAINATKRDMESNKIMDRLICGDVGFGKTEIAIRAAFKAVQSGKQVAVLVPTTILARQHYNTFTQRMKDYPVNIAMVSRLRTPAERAKTAEGLKKGLVDIVIGTHALLSDKIGYKNLGLLVVDEEQRFGVTHKEKIKKLKENVDVLTLSATPIPRTLHMSLIGIRDMSVLTQPPVDRLPIQTYVLEYDEQTIREAIIREISRNGQVYFVSNRVNDITEVSSRLQKLVPEAVIAYAHGRMSKNEIENVMMDFINREIDVLVSTTIIETGLDISNVNTMIIADADRFGLSQLYQLRGRVGRSNRTAFAFLMYKQDKIIREVAEKRLAAIREFTELGSGIRIAMKDLEIRGAGSILGSMQSGHMEEVGYDLYCKLLNEEVGRLKGNDEKPEFETQIDLNVSAFIPSSYIPNEYIRLEMYKKISLITDEDDMMNVNDEMFDRFGEMPVPVDNIIKTAYLKALAHRAQLVSLKQEGMVFRLMIYEKADVDPAAIEGLVKTFKGKLRFDYRKKPFFIYSMENMKVNDGGRMDAVYKNLKEVLNEIYEQIIIKKDGTDKTDKAER